MSTSDKKRVIVAGAAGTIGKALSKRLVERGYDLVAFSRDPDMARKAVCLRCLWMRHLPLLSAYGVSFRKKPWI